MSYTQVIKKKKFPFKTLAGSGIRSQLKFII